MKLKSLNIAIIRPFGGNVGNHVINRSLKYLVKECTSSDNINFIDIPASRKLDSGIFSGIDKNTVLYLNELADGVIVGGGNLYENGELDVDEVALNSLTAPLMLFSNSIGRIIGRSGNYIARTDHIKKSSLMQLTNKAELSLSRDSQTQYLLKSNFGCESEVGYCPTIHVKNAYELTDLPLKENLVYISIRNPDRISGSEHHKYIVGQSLENIINYQVQKKEPPVILCNDLRDLRYAEYLKQRFGVNYEFTNDDQEFIQKLNNAKFVFSFRLHTTIPCTSIGTPVLSVSYDERANSLLNDIGLQDINIDLTINTDVNLDEKVNKIVNMGSKDLTKKWPEISSFQMNRMAQFIGSCNRYNSTQC
jgi:hypothetical protein